MAGLGSFFARLFGRGRATAPSARDGQGAQGQTAATSASASTDTSAETPSTPPAPDDMPVAVGIYEAEVEDELIAVPEAQPSGQGEAQEEAQEVVEELILVTPTEPPPEDEGTGAAPADETAATGEATAQGGEPATGAS